MNDNILRYTPKSPDRVQAIMIDIFQFSKFRKGIDTGQIL